MGDFQPLAHVNGCSGCNLIALICNKNSAILSAELSKGFIVIGR
jgi:MinD superfamily P-loop ATPase